MHADRTLAVTLWINCTRSCCLRAIDDAVHPLTLDRRPHRLHHFDRRREDEGSSDACISHCRRVLQTLRQGFMPRPVFHPGQYLVTTACLHSAKQNVFCWATEKCLGDSASKPSREETKSGHLGEQFENGASFLSDTEPTLRQGRNCSAIQVDSRAL